MNKITEFNEAIEEFDQWLNEQEKHLQEACHNPDYKANNLDRVVLNYKLCHFSGNLLAVNNELKTLAKNNPQFYSKFYTKDETGFRKWIEIKDETGNRYVFGYGTGYGYDYDYWYDARFGCCVKFTIHGKITKNNKVELTYYSGLFRYGPVSWLTKFIYEYFTLFGYCTEKNEIIKRDQIRKQYTHSPEEWITNQDRYQYNKEGRFGYYRGYNIKSDNQVFLQIKRRGKPYFEIPYDDVTIQKILDQITPKYEKSVEQRDGFMRQNISECDNVIKSEFSARLYINDYPVL